MEEWLKKLKDGLIQDDPDPEWSNLDRMDGRGPAGDEERPQVDAGHAPGEAAPDA